MPQLTFLQAISAAQQEEMRRDSRVFLMGEDVRCNMFGVTTGYIEEFGLERVRDTPISEASLTGVAAGAAMVGMRPILDYTLGAFMYLAVDQLFSIVAKSRYLYGGQTSVPAVFRANMIYGNSMAAQHSDRPYSFFMGMPGLKIVIPSNAYDAKGLLKSAIRDDDPVLFFEDTSLWSAKSEIPQTEYLLPLGKGKVVRDGSDVTVVAIGAMVGLAQTAARTLEAEGISVEIVDPRSLAPLDRDLILGSVKKTGRVVVVDVSFETCSAASEIAAIVADEGFWDLRGPVIRVTVPPTHIPFSPVMERPLYPTAEKVIGAIRKAMG